MKSYTQLMEELRAHDTPDQSDLNEATIHVVPHGNKGTHYKVVKGLKGQLENGEVISDTDYEDLHDVGHKIKVLKEDELTEEEALIAEGPDAELDDPELMGTLAEEGQRDHGDENPEDDVDPEPIQEEGVVSKVLHKFTDMFGSSKEQVDEATDPDVQRNYDAEEEHGGMPGIHGGHHGHFFNDLKSLDGYKKAYPGVKAHRGVNFAYHPNDKVK